MAQPLPSRRQAKEPIAAEGLHAPALAPALFCETVGGAGAVADELGTGTGAAVEAVGADIMMEEVVWIGDWIGFAADWAGGRVVVVVDVAAAFGVEWVLGTEIASDDNDGLGFTLVMSVDSVDLMPEFVLVPGGEMVGLDTAALVFDAVMLVEGCEMLAEAILIVFVVVLVLLALKYLLLKGTITKVDALEIVLGGTLALELGSATLTEIELDRTTALELVMMEEAVLATLEVLMFAIMLDTLATAALDGPMRTTLTGTLLFG